MKRPNIFPALHATKVLLDLPGREYRPALARMADLLRAWAPSPELPKEQARAAAAALRQLEQRLG